MKAGPELSALLPEVREALKTCESELIHLPGSIQPHGGLLVIEEGPAGRLVVTHASENVAELLGVSDRVTPGLELSAIFGPVAELLEPGLREAPLRSRPIPLAPVVMERDGRGRRFHALAHRNGSRFILELEPLKTELQVGGIHPVVEAFTAAVETIDELPMLCRRTAEAIRKITDLDRALIYRFDPDWNGTVVGESGTGRLPELLEHRFPAEDIPAQARRLYEVNRVRLIPDAGYTPVPIFPPPSAGEAPLDLSFSTLRSVSPVHLEYMKNMGTSASMSVSIMSSSRLWGLISCHHRDPKVVSFEARFSCDLVARAFALRLAVLELQAAAERRTLVQSTFADLLAKMAAEKNFHDTLVQNADALLRFADADGAAVIAEGRCSRVGKTPAEAEVRELFDWVMSNRTADVFWTDALSSRYPAAAEYYVKASGMLAILLSSARPGGVLWFRREILQTIKWGGYPRKEVTHTEDGPRLSPRRSFATWKEIVRGKSREWRTSEIEGAKQLRDAIVDTVLRQVDELGELNAELTRSNTELEAFSYSVSHDLRAPLRHIVGYAEMLREAGAGTLTEKGLRCVRTVIESAEYAGILVDKLLAYSRLGRGELQRTNVDLSALTKEVVSEVMSGIGDRRITCRVEELPHVQGDPTLLREAFRNLLDNACKYSRNREEAVIEVGACEEQGEWVVWVRDNGTGFDQKYAGKLFGVFQRLHRFEDFEGTGIGLANVRRVIERHGGRTWAEGVENQGATFFFTLPK